MARQPNMASSFTFILLMTFLPCFRASALSMTAPFQNTSASVANVTIHTCLSSATGWQGTMSLTSATPGPSPSCNTTSKITPYPSRSTASVIVGAGGKLVFSPASINATVGSVVSFNFLALNHTLTQSDFSHPCVKNGTFDTEFRQFNPKNISGKFVVQYEVVTQEPQWFFCAQTLNRSHCQSGMVFSINAKGTQNQFEQNALSAANHSTQFYQGPISTCQPPVTSSYLPSSTGSATTFNLSSSFGSPTTVATPSAFISSGSINTVVVLQCMLGFVAILL